MRGVYRHFEEKGAQDIWRARVEIRPGEWTDIERATYERDGLQPTFWDLPLEDDYLASKLGDPLTQADYEFRKNVMEPATLVMMGAGATVFLVVLLGFVLVAFF